jgi:CRISPR/Cas system-associated protein Cas10 (large subunit of type III CRISPR-Cas system)
MSTNHKWLISFDTDRIKDYIFATNSLKEIRGASAILVNVEDQRAGALSIPKNDVVYSAGGSGAFFVENEDKARELAREIEIHFRQETVIGSVTAVTDSEIEDDDHKGEETWYKRLKTKVGRKMSQSKALKAELVSIPVQPYMRPCASCGQLAAEKRFHADQSGDLLCGACFLKRERGTSERYEGYLQKFRKYKGTNTEWRAAKLPDDLESLAEFDGSGYVGFIKIDGNQMGTFYDQIETREQDKAFSEGLKNLVEHLVYDAVLKHGRLKETLKRVNGDDKIEKWLPFEVVLIGGDDVMLFTTADIAIPVTIEILRRFEKEFQNVLNEAKLKTDKKYSMCASVVLCHGNFPIPALADIGEDLLKNAKKKASLIKYESGVIDFQVITGSMIDLESARAVVPYHRPYTHKQVSCLLEHAWDIKNAGVPTSQLQMVYDACMSNSKVEGTMAALRMIGRFRNLNHQRLLKQFFSDSAFKDERVSYWPWSHIKREEIEIDGQKKELERPFSAFVDLVDLYRFIQKGGQREKGRGTPHEN